MIKAVLFDVDGVLLDSFEANLDFYQSLMKRAGYLGPTREQYAERFHMPMKEFIGKIAPFASAEEVHRIWEMGRAQNDLYNQTLLALTEGTETIIPLLSARYPLGIVTSRVLVGVYERTPLKNFESHFATVVSYEDTENHKPHPDPLLLAAQRLSCTPDTCVYIGDQETDMIAARAAGMKGVHFTTMTPTFGDAHIMSLSDILTTIEGF